jgi:hypothetical protein
MLVLIGGVGALLLVGIIVLVIVTHQSETTYPPNSPQQTIATYLRLLQRGQVDEAYKLTSLTSPNEDADPSPMSRQDFHAEFDNWSQQSHRVTLLRTNTSGNQSSVTVEVSVFSGDAFGGSDETSRLTFTLVRRHGEWRITGPSSLYP